MNIFSSIKPPNKFYINLLLALSITITSTILILSSILYVNFEKIALSLIHDFVMDSLSQVSYSATLMSNSSKALALQLYFDQDIKNLMLSSEIAVNNEVAYTKKLDFYKNTNPFTHSVYIYNGKLKSFYTTLLNNESVKKAAFFDKEIIHIMSNFPNYQNMKFIPRRILDPYKKFEKDKYTNVYTIVFSDSAQSITSLDEGIILNISENYLRNMIDSLGSNLTSNTFIVDNTGKTMISSKIHPFLQDLSGEEYIKKILSLKNPSGYFISNVDGTKSLVTYYSYSAMNWVFIKVTPYNIIVDKINNMKLITLLSAFLILLIGLFLSFGISRKLYKPIDNMIIKLNTLETEKRENFYAHKQNLLQNILHGHMDINNEEITNIFANSKIKLNPYMQFAIILFKIDNFADFCNDFTLNDRNLLKFGIMNISSEIFSQYFVNECVDSGEDLVTILYNTSTIAGVENENCVEEILLNIQQSILKFLNISLSITIGPNCDSFKNVALFYTECVKTSYYRMFYGHKSIIYVDKINELTSNEYSYPVQKEKLLSEMLMLGKMEDVKKIYSEIISVTTKYQYTAFQSTLSHLASAINSAVDNMLKNSHSSLIYNYTTFIVEVSKLETLDAVNDYFIKVFDNIISEVKNKKNSKHDDLIEVIVDIINREYSNYNLSIETISDSVNMSTVYLGRLFKKMTSKSISYYITEIRMEKAKHLIRETELSINDILEKTGFVSSGYFYTLFKKIHGITPNEYRQNIKNL